MRARTRFASGIDPMWVDVAVAAALMVDLILEATLGGGLPDRLATALFAILFAAPVAVRRRWPAGAVIACTVVGLLEDAVDGQLFNLPSKSAVIVLMLCSYGAGAWLAPRRSFVAIGVAAGLLAGDQMIQLYVTHVDGGDLSGSATLEALFLVPWVGGRLVYERTRRADAFAALAAQAAAESAERERAAVTQERLTIGRELQDIIAHNVSVMVVQAGGARRLLGSEPDRARESILTVEQVGRDALAEMRRLLGLLRRDDDPRALSPQPGLERAARARTRPRRHGTRVRAPRRGRADRADAWDRSRRLPRDRDRARDRRRCPMHARERDHPVPAAASRARDPRRGPAAGRR